MESINRNKANMRVGSFFDNAQASQGSEKSMKAHAKVLSKMTGDVPMEDTNEFKKDFGSI